MALQAQSGPDSSASLAAARAAQAAFERLRLDYLPRTVSGSSGPCDEIVGRFCYWHDGDDDWIPPPEPEPIRRARDRLVRQLDSLAALAPADDWIAGQRVRYLAEAGRADDALHAALECRGTTWWCLALAAFAHHRAGRFAAADSAYADALAGMPAEERCAWTDLSVILAQQPEGYRNTPCEQRAAPDAVIWWLADPLYLTPGNERRTEHFSRHVVNRMQSNARSPYAVRWGNDLEELLLRYGWPAGWERDDTWRPADQATIRIIARHAPRSREFLPPRRFAETPSRIEPQAWDLDPDRPRSGYAPPYARDFVALDPQVGVFWRGDSAIIVAGFEPPKEDDRDSKAALAIALGPDRAPVMARDSGPGPYRLALTVPASGGLLSVEALTGGDSAMASRARYWLSLGRPAELAVSQPLLFATGNPDSIPAVLELLFDSILTRSTITPGAPVGVYWETYLENTDARTARVSLTVTRAGSPWIRRAAERLGLAGRRQPVVRLSWSLSLPRPSGTTVHPQSVAVTLPERATGRFALEIAMDVGGRVVRSERVVEVRGRL